MIVYTYKDFINYISQNKKGAILICGQEKNLIKKSTEALYATISSFPELNLIVLSGEGITRDAVINACETIPFLSDKKLVHIKNPDFLKKPKKDSTADDEKKDDGEGSEEGENSYYSGEVSGFLNKYLLSLPEYIILLITYDDDIDMKNKTALVIKGSGCYVQYNSLKARELEETAFDMFKNHGKDIKKAELAYLVSDISSIDELEVEIDKICAYAMYDEIITRGHIDAVMHRSLEGNVFKLVDALSRKNADSAMSILNMLLYQGENHLKILAMIIRQYRMLYQIKGCLSEGENEAEIKNLLKIKSDGVVRNLISQTRAAGIDMLKKALNSCLDADLKIKSGKFSPNLALEFLIVDLCK